MFIDFHEECKNYLEDWQRLTLRITGYTMMAAMIFNLGYLFHNIYRFIIPLQVKSFHILSFYILAIIQMVARAVELSYISDPADDCVSVTNPYEYGQMVADFIGTFAN